MPLNFAVFEQSAVAEYGFQFASAPASGDAFHAIFDGNPVPSEKKLGERQEVVGDPMAMQILDEHEL